MKRIINFTVAVIFFVVMLFLVGAIYVLPETQQAVITQFGMPIKDPVTQAGLHFKLPFIQHVSYFEKRLLEWDGDPNQIPTRDKRYIWVDTTARWKIVDALKFLRTVGSERGAHARLDDIINSATRDVITGHVLVESIRDSNRILDLKGDIDSIAFAEEALERVKTGRQGLEKQILERAQELAPQYGIELVDVRIERINYVEEVRKKVYDRMISERKRAAEQYRSEGRGKSAEIRGEREKLLKQIESEAYKSAQEIRGSADAEAISVYADAYSKDPGFYSFMKTLETYKDTIDDGTTIMLSTDSDYYRYIKRIE
ncbi:MAG: protease modulator HflC [Candidatus Omnitrophica bacterium]|nr:protease modulator HflC [Candidatus Omnitrophota bacterium]MDD5488650.1 protease modulator HflC [Candidatus Omnitrophota bacterium]